MKTWQTDPGARFLLQLVGALDACRLYLVRTKAKDAGKRTGRGHGPADVLRGNDDRRLGSPTLTCSRHRPPKAHTPIGEPRVRLHNRSDGEQGRVVHAACNEPARHALGFSEHGRSYPPCSKPGKPSPVEKP
jgi:hypothetical protein